MIDHLYCVRQTYLGMLGMRRKLLLQVFHDVRHNSIEALKAKKNPKRANLAFDTFRQKTIHEIKQNKKDLCLCSCVRGQYLLSMEFSQMAEGDGKGLSVVLLHTEVHRLQTVHVQQELSLLPCHSATENTNKFSLKVP